MTLGQETRWVYSTMLPRKQAMDNHTIRWAKFQLINIVQLNRTAEVWTLWTRKFRALDEGGATPLEEVLIV